MSVFIPSPELFAVFAILLAILLHFQRKTKDSNFPPGPTPFPIIGNLLQCGRRPRIALQKWAKEYGGMIGLTFGPQKIVVLTDGKLVKELFSDMRACGRPRNPVYDVYSKGNFGIVQSDGQVWIEQRRFALRTWKDIGFSKSSMEGRILEEATTFLDFLNEREGQWISGRGLFTHTVLNTIWSILSGERSDPETTHMLDMSIGAANRITNNGLLFIPVLRHFAPEAMGWNNAIKTVERLKDKITATISKQAAAEIHSEQNNFISRYLVHMNKEMDESSSFYKENGRINYLTLTTPLISGMNLIQMVSDFFIAGSETTSTALEFMMLYLSYHTDAQKKVQKEIDNVIGQTRQPSLADRVSMPYTEAVLLEVFRTSAFLSVGLPHAIVEDMEFHGYNLPKGTIILADFPNIFHDPKRWGDDAKVFRPERHLEENETKLNRPDDLIPFSTGKRECPAKAVGNDTLFLFTTSIFQRFNVGMELKTQVVDLRTIYGFSCKPKPFNVVVKTREIFCCEE